MHKVLSVCIFESRLRKLEKGRIHQESQASDCLWLLVPPNCDFIPREFVLEDDLQNLRIVPYSNG